MTHELWQWGIKRSGGCEDIKDTSADRTWQRDGHHGREGGQHLSRLYQEGIPSLFSDKQGWPGQTRASGHPSVVKTKPDWNAGVDLMAQERLALNLRQKLKCLLWGHTAGSWYKVGGGERSGFRPGLSRENYKGLWAPQ